MNEGIPLIKGALDGQAQGRPIVPKKNNSPYEVRWEKFIFKKMINEGGISGK
ncbi:hypothetical protein HUG20_10645 [Salicibibacter cibi]|uniref:Uncharacterized protein n=1 Tax=Salicibibacter cibi TaxID=2743001 RepID=A0A7T6ZB78_9BACI|nr:hypothetical protein [Salicibibacter cibi]QQK80304.1 hypothetical protein HUG20_10645 [Salicibibacter cibi]